MKHCIKVPKETFNWHRLTYYHFNRYIIKILITVLTRSSHFICADLLLSSTNLPFIAMSTSKATASKLVSRKGSKISTSEQGSSYDLDVKIIHPQNNLALDGWLYTIRDCSVLFPEVNEAESVK